MSILYPGKMSEEQGAGGGKWRSGGTDRGMHNPFTGKQYTWRGACYSDG